jgi:hypothetical protein
VKDCTIEYKLLGFIPFRWKRTIPERWDEVTPEQLITLSSLYLSEINDSQMIASFYRIPKLVASRMPPFYVWTLVNELDFISDFQPCSRFMIKKFAGSQPPKPRLEGMTFGQFIFVDTYFEEYADSANPESLHKFIASLYTPAKKPFSDKQIPTQAATVAKQCTTQMQAIVINYRLVREWLMEAYPVIFSKDKKKEGDNVPVKRNKQGWLDVLDSLVDEDIVNFDKYAQMPLHNVLRHMSKKIKDNAKRPKV